MQVQTQITIQKAFDMTKTFEVWSWSAKRSDFPEITWEPDSSGGSITFESSNEIALFIAKHEKYYICFHDNTIFIDTCLFKQR